MKIGQPVKGIMTQHWRFVEDDLYGIADRVIEYDEDARLAIHTEGRLGIVRYARAEWAPEGAWVVAFNLNDDDSVDGYWYGEPDARVLDQMGRADLRRKDVATRTRQLRRLWQLHELAQELDDREEARELAERTIHRYRNAEGQKRRIYVP
jgi:hypothetical protein